VPDPEGVLITGVYGAGKSSVAAEIAYLLELRGERFALLDLDYLSWATCGDGTRASNFAMLERNLAAVAANYAAAGVTRLVLAYFVCDDGEVQRLCAAAGVPLRVVRLDLSAMEITRRLATDVTSGRQDDLDVALASMAAGHGVGCEEMAIANDRPVGTVAQEILAYLGWQ
jgi:hypothetical protein